LVWHTIAREVEDRPQEDGGEPRPARGTGCSARRDVERNDHSLKGLAFVTTVSVTTAGNQPPTANAGGPYSGTAGVLMTFNGGGSFDPDGTISSYVWSFGDGGSATGVAPAYTYGTSGTYTVTLTVTDNKGASRSATTWCA
jgi:hypothetical protein